MKCWFDPPYGPFKNWSAICWISLSELQFWGRQYRLIDCATSVFTSVFDNGNCTVSFVKHPNVYTFFCIYTSLLLELGGRWYSFTFYKVQESLRRHLKHNLMGIWMWHMLVLMLVLVLVYQVQGTGQWPMGWLVGITRCLAPCTSTCAMCNVHVS